MGNGIETLIFGYRVLVDGNGVEVVQRSRAKFIGATIADNAATGTTEVTLGDPAASVVPSLVYRPNGTTSGNVYATEAELLAALPSAGVATVLLDGSANGGTVPIAQTWPLDSRIRLVARKTTTVTLTGKLVDPCYLEQLYVSADPAGASAIEFADTAPTFELRDCSLSSVSASKPVLLVEAGDTIKLVASGTTLITRDAYEVFDKDAGGRLFVWLRDEASIGDDTIRGTTSDEKPTRILLDSAAASASTTQTNLTGAVVVALEEVATNVAFSVGEWVSTNAQAAIQEAEAKAEAASVPTGRTLTGAGGVLVDGDTSAHDLSADRTISLTYGSSASTVCEGNDSRLSNARTPTGSAGGDLGGTYPSPSVAKLNGATAPAAGALTTGHVAMVSGASALSYGFIADANVSATAAIAGTKIAPNFGSQNVSTTGTLAAGATTITGGATLKTGTTTIGTLGDNGSSGLKVESAAAVRVNANGGTLTLFSAYGNDLVFSSGRNVTLVADAIAVLDRSSNTRIVVDALSTAAFRFDKSCASATVKQDDNTTASATGATTTLQAQNATGTTSTGGALVLASGTGTTAAGAVSINAGATTRIKADATGIGFFGATPIAKPSVSGSKGSNAALASLCTQLASLGLITDSTT